MSGGVTVFGGQGMEFWFEFASTYSYLSVMRIEKAAEQAGVDVAWKPLMLGPIFGAQGWTDSPFNIYPAKGRFMWRDMERRAQALGLPFRQPPGFPQHTVMAARVAYLALQQNGGRDFVRALYHAQFADGQNVAEPEVVGAALNEAGLPVRLIDEAQAPEVKAALRAQVDDAQQKGIFGAPSFVVGEELFWGDDQLEMALEWAGRL
ncbi:hypothetical protein CFI11_13535 [Thalassococcus sp. S3]|nr:hypothetical protein CFI11_13535 [Thalassococcus sp. S3]